MGVLSTRSIFQYVDYLLRLHGLHAFAHEGDVLLYYIVSVVVVVAMEFVAFYRRHWCWKRQMLLCFIEAYFM
jgi:hypothetical protein